MTISGKSGEQISQTLSENGTNHFQKRRSFFRSTLFQILVVGLCAFCAPGIWSAMNGLGVGGSQSPNLVNAANALLYAFMSNLLRRPLVNKHNRIPLYTGNWLDRLPALRSRSVPEQPHRRNLARLSRLHNLRSQCRLLLERRRRHRNRVSGTAQTRSLHRNVVHIPEFRKHHRRCHLPGHQPQCRQTRASRLPNLSRLHRHSMLGSTFWSSTIEPRESPTRRRNSHRSAQEHKLANGTPRHVASCPK